MKFQLVKNKIKRLNIEPINGEIEQKNSFSFTHSCNFDDKEMKVFIISFKFELISGRNYKLDFMHDFYFQTDEDITDEFLKSHYPSVNAPAIAYPYVRAFVANLLLNAGLESVLLPAVNFVEHAKSQKE